MNNSTIYRALIKRTLFVLICFISLNASAATYTSVQDGDWNTAATWDCNCVPAVNAGHTIIIDDNVSVAGALNVEAATSITVNAGAALTTNGILGITTGSSLTNAGTITVSGGNFNVASSTLSNSGTINGGADISFSAASTITNSGTMDAAVAFKVNLDTGFGFTSTGGTLEGATMEFGPGAAMVTTFSNTTINVAGLITFSPPNGSGTLTNCDVNAGALTIGASTTTLNLVGTTVDLTGDLETLGSGRLIADASSPIVVGGKFNNTGSVSSVFNGDLTITGNVTTTGSSPLTLNGRTSVGGSFTASGGGSPTSVGGYLTIGTTLNLSGGDATNLTGTGGVSWTTNEATGGSYIGCNGVKYDRGDIWTGYAVPPNNPLNLQTCAAYNPCTVAAASSSPTACINTAITSITHATTGVTGVTSSTGLPAGVSASYAGDVLTISGTPTESGTFNYTIDVAGCGTDATGTITVTAANTAAAASSTPTLCINTALTNITHATTGATGISNSGVSGGNGLPTGVSAAWAGDVITISGTPTASGTFNYSIPLTGGCGSVNATGTITVTEANTAGAASSTPTLCINTALTNITHATTGATGIANDGTDGANGLPAGVSAAWAGNTITISGTPSASGTFNYSIALTGGCGTVNATGTITVTAANTAGAASSTPTLCINTALTNITHATTGATGIANDGTDGGNGLPAGVSATWAGNTITISGTPSASGTFNYSIALTGGCGAVNATGTITVTANRTVGAASTATQTVCYNTAITSVTHATTGVTGITSSAGLPTGVTAAYAANVITISGIPTQSGTFNYTITPTSTCGSATATGEIIVRDDLAAGAIAAAQTITYNTAPAAFTSTTAASGGGGFTYLWQSSADNSTWSDIGGAIFATYTSGALTSDTWFRRAAISSAGCGTQYTASVKITVIVRVCTGSAPSAISEQTAPSGGSGAGTYSYTWESSTDGVTFGAPIPGATAATYTPTAIVASTWYRRCVTSGSCTECTQAIKATIKGGPGGITGPLVWLKADAGTGSIGTQWADQSGNGNHYTTSGSPTVNSGDSSSNYNPYIILNGGEGFDAPAGAALGSSYTLFAVAKKLNTDLNGTVIDGHSAGYQFAFSGNDTAKVAQSITSSSLAAQGIQVDINVGASSGSGCDAHIYELIIYNRVLPSDSIEIIESYLETKYGVKGSDNYKSSTGVTTYDASSYSNDIIGIGKEECYFHQKQSETSDDSLKITVGAFSDFAATNATNGQSVTNDASYLMVGHNGGKMKGTSATSADIPPASTMGSDGSTPITILTRIDREWKITNTNFSNTYTLKFEVIPTGLTANDIVLMVDDDGDFTDCGIAAGTGLYFNGDGSGITISIGSIEIEGVGAGIIGAGAKFIALGSKDADSPLPVELINFNAAQKVEYNLISWTTASEINSSHFNVQKSTDGVNWETIKVVNAAGNSNEPINYSVMDKELCAPRCYYRLHQVDFDGKSDYSKIIMIEVQDKAKTNLIIYPVPVTGNTTVQFIANETGMYYLEVYSVSGASVFEANVVCVEGKNEFNMNTSTYASGMYYLVIKDVNGEVMNRITFTK